MTKSTRSVWISIAVFLLMVFGIYQGILYKRNQARSNTSQLLITYFLNVGDYRSALQFAREAQKSGWVGQDNTPDTIWAQDSCYFVWIDKNGRGGLERSVIFDSIGPPGRIVTDTLWRNK